MISLENLCGTKTKDLSVLYIPASFIITAVDYVFHSFALFTKEPIRLKFAIVPNRISYCVVPDIIFFLYIFLK
jgi:hypothetical protein